MLNLKPSLTASQVNKEVKGNKPKELLSAERFKKSFANAQSQGYTHDIETFASSLENEGYAVEGFSERKKAKEKNTIIKQQIQKEQQLATQTREKRGGIVQNVVGAAADSTAGIAELGLKGVSNAAERVAKKLGREDLAQRFDSAEKQTIEQVGDVGQDTDSLGYKIPKTVADIAQVATPTGIVSGASKLGAVGGKLGQLSKFGDDVLTKGGQEIAGVGNEVAQLAKSIGAVGIEGLKKLGLGPRVADRLMKTAGSIAGGAAEGVKDVALYEAVSKSELPDEEDLKFGVVAGGALNVVGSAISKLGDASYQAAFQQVKQSLDEKSIQAYGIRAGKLVNDESLKGRTIGAIKKETGERLKATWKVLENKAKGTTPLDVVTLGSSLKSDLVKKIAEGLPENTENYKAIVTNIDEIVDFFIGTEGKVQGIEAVNIIKEMNSQIPAGALKKSELALDPKKASTLIKGLKNSIQKELESVNPGIIKLYGDYSRKRLIHDIISNVEVKKMLGRTLLSGVVGGTTAAAVPLSEGKYGQAIRNAVLGGIVFGLIGRKLTSPDMLLKGGKFLQSAGDKAAKVVAPAKEIKDAIEKK